MGCYEEALASYVRALELNSQNISIWNTKIELLTHLGRRVDVLAAERQRDAVLHPRTNISESNSVSAPEAAPKADDPESHPNCQKGEEEGPVQHEHVQRLNPQGAALRSSHARVLLSQRRYEEALTACDQALALDPQCADAWAIRGHALVFLGSDRYD